MTQPKYPDVHVIAWHENEHAYVILHRVRQAFRWGGISSSVWTDFHVEATSGDYDHLLRTVRDWVTVDDEEDDNE